MNEPKPNVITMVMNADHLEFMRSCFTADRWSEFTRINDESDLHFLLAKCRKAGMYGLANEINQAWKDSHESAKEKETTLQQSLGWPLGFEIGHR